MTTTNSPITANTPNNCVGGIERQGSIGACAGDSDDVSAWQQARRPAAA